MSRVSGRPYFVYVLWSEAGRRFYTGISEDPQHRLEQHNAGEHGWTRRHRPWIMVHAQRFDDYGSARRRENELKAHKGGQGFFKSLGLAPSRFAGSGS